ncbi:ribosomal protein S16 domain-containing protein [Dipodascopsis tothii]|uniref:ribosomal protein S16 domain-containing protein n=1 Tax=Dipodascopsis tothii TaxID=44089 RepID=UPI0034CF9A06
MFVVVVPHVPGRRLFVLGGALSFSLHAVPAKLFTVLSSGRTSTQEAMVVCMRLVRMGRKHNPVYNIVVATQRTGLRRKPIEVIGTYNSIPQAPPPGEDGPMVKNVELDFTRTKYWLGVGAQPSDAVARLFKLFGLLPEQYPGPSRSLKSGFRQTPKANQK